MQIGLSNGGYKFSFQSNEALGVAFVSQITGILFYTLLRYKISKYYIG